MAYSILNLKQDLTGVIHGTTLNKVQNLDNIIDRSARDVLRDVNPMETIRIAQFATPIFEGAYTYALAEDVKGNTIIDIRPQINRGLGDIYNQDYSQQFNLSKNNSLADQFNIQWNSGVRTIQLNSPLLNTGVVLNYVSSLTDNGTWVASGGANNLSVSNDYLVGGGSLQFDLSAGSSTGTLTNSTMTAVDLSDFLNQAYLFLSAYISSSPSGITQYTLNFGSSSSDYYTATTTLTQANTAFATGWNQLSFNWNNLTTTGTPDDSSISFAQIVITYDSTARTAMKLNNLTCLTGQIMEYVYYSKYLFRDATTGAFQETVTDDSNLINLDTDSYNLLFNKTAYYTAQQLQGSDAVYDATFFGGDDGTRGEYGRALSVYKAKYKSEIQKPKQLYYPIQKGNYNSTIARRWY